MRVKAREGEGGRDKEGEGAIMRNEERKKEREGKGKMEKAIE